MYADYEFYKGTYGGKVSEKEYTALANTATAYIDNATFGRSKETTGDALEAVKMAQCALVDVLNDENTVNASAFSSSPTVSSETVGSWSKSYSTRSVSGTEVELLEKRKWDVLVLYLGPFGLLKANAFYVRGCVR